MKISVKGFITSKEDEQLYHCADRFSYSKEHNRFAISDGVSRSFFPKIWSEVLVKTWVSNPKLNDNEFISSCQSDWFDQVSEIASRPDAKYYTRNAYNMRSPGLATMVGLRMFEDNGAWTWEAKALGDSFLFFVPLGSTSFDEWSILSSKSKPYVFDNYPDYLSSVGNSHNGTPKRFRSELKDGTFYLMTDALAEWFIKEQMNAVGKVSVWSGQDDFERFVQQSRESESLGDDDTAILIVEILDSQSSKVEYTLENVSDICELIEKQNNEQRVTEAFISTDDDNSNEKSSSSGKEEPSEGVSSDEDEPSSDDGEELETNSESFIAIDSQSEVSNESIDEVENKAAEKWLNDQSENNEVDHESKTDRQNTDGLLSTVLKAAAVSAIEFLTGGPDKIVKDLPDTKEKSGHEKESITTEAQSSSKVEEEIEAESGERSDGRGNNLTRSEPSESSQNSEIVNTKVESPLHKEESSHQKGDLVENLRSESDESGAKVDNDDGVEMTKRESKEKLNSKNTDLTNSDRAKDISSKF